MCSPDPEMALENFMYFAPTIAEMVNGHFLNRRVSKRSQNLIDSHLQILFEMGLEQGKDPTWEHSGKASARAAASVSWSEECFSKSSSKTKVLSPVSLSIQFFTNCSVPNTSVPLLSLILHVYSTNALGWLNFSLWRRESFYVWKSSVRHKPLVWIPMYIITMNIGWKQSLNTVGHYLHISESDVSWPLYHNKKNSDFMKIIDWRYQWPENNRFRNVKMIVDVFNFSFHSYYSILNSFLRSIRFSNCWETWWLLMSQLKEDFSGLDGVRIWEDEWMEGSIKNENLSILRERSLKYRGVSKWFLTTGKKFPWILMNTTQSLN